MGTSRDGEPPGDRARDGGRGGRLGELASLSLAQLGIAWLFSAPFGAVLAAPAGTQLAYAALTGGVSALAALGLTRLADVPHSTRRRLASDGLAALLLIPPMLGVWACGAAVAQVLGTPRNGGAMLGLLLYVVWELALVVLMVRAIQRRRAGRRDRAN